MVQKTAAFRHRRAADTARWRERLHRATGRPSGLHDRERQHIGEMRATARHRAGIGSSQSMLALTDSALARLCIAATRMRAVERKRWLRELANKIAPPQRSTAMLSQSKAAVRKREQRKRWADGRVVLNTEINECDFVEALLRARRLTEAEALDRHLL